MPVALRLALIADRQHGPIALEQLLEFLDSSQIKRWVAAKRLWRVYPTVYTLGYRELDDLGTWSAATLACRPKAALACRSAAQYHRIHTLYDGYPEVTVGRPDRPRVKEIRTRTTSWGPGEVVCLDHIWVTTLERTLLDLAGVLSFDELSQSFQKALAIRTLSLNTLERIIERHPNAKGRRSLKKLIARHRDDQGYGRGDFENDFYPWLKSRLPKRFAIRRNVNVRFDDGVTRQADFLIDNVWIETDYHGHHAGAGPKKATEDHQRDRAIRNADYQLGRYTDYEFKTDKPAIEADIRRMLGLSPRRARGRLSRSANPP